jgi:hypothetical protein
MFRETHFNKTMKFLMITRITLTECQSDKKFPTNAISWGRTSCYLFTITHAHTPPLALLAARSLGSIVEKNAQCSSFYCSPESHPRGSMACRSLLRTRLALERASRRLLYTLRPGAELDTSYLCDPKRVEEIQDNIKRRDAQGDIILVQKLFQEFQESKSEKVWNQFAAEALKIPNRTLDHRDENKKIKVFIGSC